ncbi:MAG: hypothetical protein AB8B91_00030 [Rubripirellula sp.]
MKSTAIFRSTIKSSIAMRVLTVCFTSLLLVPALLAAEPTVYLTKTPDARATALKSSPWIDLIKREIPPLKHKPKGHLPMIMWHGVGFEPLGKQPLKVLRDRGLCQHLQLSDHMIPAAKALQREKMPVILMEGRTDHWPYSLAKDPTHWPHDFDATYLRTRYAQEESDSQWHGACLLRTAGWKVLEKNTRETLTKFRDAGVQVDAVLVDYEGDPYPWSHLFEQIKHCKRCRKELPTEIIHDKSAWRTFCWKQYLDLYDQHFAKAVREVFPDCLVTNWHVVYSGQVVPVRYFVRDVQLPFLQPKFFNATNPIAYGSDLVWHEQWNPGHNITRKSVDDFYAFQIKHQVMADRKNRLAVNAEKVRSIPWVARVCRINIDDQRPLPVMSRSEYRKTLVELWQQERVHSMQIFNPMQDGYEELALTEVQDAVAAYDAMLSQD